MTDDRVLIFDTTLRDGEQSPGASMTQVEKLEVARALAGLGVDIIEAGFPIASPGDFEAVRIIATEITGAVVCGLARCNDRDIDRAWEALRYAQSPRIHVFLATSAIHREHKLRMTTAQVVEKAVASVRKAKSFLSRTSSSAPRTRRRTEVEFLCEVVEAAIEAGATTVNIPGHRRLRHPDPVRPGHPDPPRAGPEYHKAVISTHCHDDLGLAVANSLAACEAGAGRWNAPSTASASAPATPRSKRSSWR